MDTSIIHSSGILKKGEEIIEFIPGNARSITPDRDVFMGYLLLTNKRLVFLEKPGLFSKGLTIKFSYSLGDIESVSPGGLIDTKLTISINESGQIIPRFFACKNSQLFAQKIVGAKQEFVEEKIVEAKKVIIEEGNKDDAMEILKKRLARGEITIEEFHEKVQRT